MTCRKSQIHLLGLLHNFPVRRLFPSPVYSE
uniref:Uncharacterized protein n=1 Tax=Anguilla anguilla TaxID=7936 RepID=A0A0E9U4J0_ANGAN